MYYSRYNLVFPMKENAQYPYALMNSLSGAFDLVGAQDYLKLEELKNGLSPEDSEFTEYLLSRGYLYHDQGEEQLKLATRYPEFQKALDETPPQVLLIPTYNCNLACPYCYQNGIKHKKELIDKEVIEAFYTHLEHQFPMRKPFITLFGGEALAGSVKQKEIIDYIVKKAADLGYEIAAVTNGYDLADYVDILSQAKVKEIQVTLDGPKHIHDTRRFTAGGKGSYDRIIEGLEKTINKGIPVNLRAVVDKSNYHELVVLAEDFEQRGWLELPATRFKTQIGRNYELFECYAAPSHLLSQIEHWAMFVELAEKYPILKKFHQPEFKGINHLVQTGELYLPSYDTCPACKTEWVYDLYGDIYGCTATAGQDNYKLGTFYPEYTLNQDDVNEWQERNILTIDECRECEVSLICGGGCGAIAKDRLGKVKAPDCRPIRDILGLGIQYYGDQLLKMGY